LLKARASGAPGGGRVLGEHPLGGVISVRDGRYGAYVSHGKVNATIPKDQSPESVTLEDAIQWIDDKGGPDKKAIRKGPATKSAAKKSAAKKAPAKKAPAKKAAAKKAPAKKAAAKKVAAKK